MSHPPIHVPRRPVLAQCAVWGIAAFYLYGACVHVANMLSLTGFDWWTSPAKWRVLDVIYLVLDIAVAAGLLAGKWIGSVAFFAAALSQIMLYTVYRDWIVDVPVAFQRSADQLAYLDTLVMFHVVSCAVMVWALWVRHTAHPGV